MDRSSRNVRRVDAAGAMDLDDVLAVEEPLEIRVGDRPVSVTLRTPGHDFDLAAGFLFTESILRDPAEVESIRHWGSGNVVRVAVRDDVHPDLQRLQRHFYSTSSCGVCGKVSIDAVRVRTEPLNGNVRVSRQVVSSLPGALRSGQSAFDATGAIHGAGVFSPEGDLLRLREDVGRHNAVDKVVGSFFREGRTLGGTVLFVSGRASFEIVQKAIVARIPVVAAAGAPSSLAVDLAEEMGLTLIGFVRGERFNVYAGAGRVA